MPKKTAAVEFLRKYPRIKGFQRVLAPPPGESSMRKYAGLKREEAVVRLCQLAVTIYRTHCGGLLVETTQETNQRESSLYYSQRNFYACSSHTRGQGGTVMPLTRVIVLAQQHRYEVLRGLRVVP